MLIVADVPAHSLATLGDVALIGLVGGQVVAAVVIAVQLARLDGARQGMGAGPHCLGGFVAIAAQLARGKKAAVAAGIDIADASCRCRKKCGRHSPYFWLTCCRPPCRICLTKSGDHCCRPTCQTCLWRNGPRSRCWCGRCSRSCHICYCCPKSG